MMMEMVYNIVLWINKLPSNDGISKVIILRNIVVGLPIDYKAHGWYEFGGCVQTYKKHENSMES